MFMLFSHGTKAHSFDHLIIFDNTIYKIEAVILRMLLILRCLKIQVEILVIVLPVDIRTIFIVT